MGYERVIGYRIARLFLPRPSTALAAVQTMRIAYFSPSAWDFPLSRIRRSAVSSMPQPQSIASRQKVKSARLMSG
jgi:hypothetical protein